MANKYWIANNPNAEVDNAQCVALKNLSSADLTEIEEAVASFDELRALAAAVPMVAEADHVESDLAALIVAFNSLLAKLRTAGLLTA